MDRGWGKNSKGKVIENTGKIRKRLGEIRQCEISNSADSFNNKQSLCCLFSKQEDLMTFPIATVSAGG